MNTINLYKTRTMMEAIEVIPTNESFLLDTFCSDSETFPTESFDIDFVKGKKKIAPFVAKYKNGIQMERNVVATKNYEPAKIQPSRPLTVETLMQRLAGEAVYGSSKTPAMRAAELLARDLRELKDMVDRRKEWMIAQVLFNGAFTANVHTDADNYYEDAFDYGHTLQVTPSVKWTEALADTSKPIDDLQAQAEAIATSSGKYPNIVIMGSKALAGFLASKQVKEYFDIHRYDFGAIQPSIKSTQVQYIGRLLRPNVEIYTYAESYLDEDGNLMKFVPDNKVLIANRNIFSMKYGAVTQMENGQFQTYAGELVPKYDAVDHENTSWLTLTSKPVPVPFDVDAWATLTVAD
jgi:hypothetical protein